MKTDRPSLQEWKELYEAAVKFKEQRCWNWMGDNEIFGVKDPGSGMIDYCCIMGRIGEHFGLGVYKGYKGLGGLISIINEDVKATNIDALHVQNCLMASFEDRKYLQKRDLDIIKKLGLKFRGVNAWPFFRDYTSGYHPWFLNSD